MIWLAVRRPITTLTATAALAVLGAMSLVRVPLDLLPQVELPRLEVHVAWVGASPEMVESLVTARVEAVAQSVRGVKSVASTSYPERAVVTVEFARGTDMEFARLELSERLAALARSLPPGADRPLVEPYVPDAFAINNQALLSYALVGPSTIGGLGELAVQRVEPAIRAVEGVDGVETVGGTDRELQVRLDAVRLAAHSLAPSDVRDAIATGLNISGSGATIRRHDREWTIAIADRANRVSDVETLVLRRETSSSAALRLGDVADVAFSYAEPRSHYRVDGEPAVTLFIHAEAGSNAIQVADRVRERMAELVPDLPLGFQLIEDHDRTKKIRFEMSRLRDRALIAVAVVLLVLVLAFRRLAPAFIACGSVAASILTAIGLLRVGGLSLNLLTLAGLAMGIGLVVDNAIVVLERIEARRTQGESPIAAAAHGAREVALPVLAATATTLIVFAPFLYAQGELRVYYVPFAWTVVAVLAVSLVIALTAVPTLAARTVFGPSAGTTGSEGRSIKVVKPSLPRRGFRGTIVWTLRHPRMTVSAAFVALVLSGWLFWDRVPRGRIWGERGDETFLSIQIEMPRGSELDHTDRISQGFEERLDRIPEVKRYVTRVQSEFGHIRASFPDNLTTTEIPAEIKERLLAYSREYGGTEVRVYGFGPSFYGGSGGTPSYSLKLLGYDYRELERLASDLAARLRSFPRIRDVNPNASGLWFERDQETELVLVPDRSRLVAYGVSVTEFLDRAAVAIQGRINRDRVEIAGREVSLDVKVD
ncbi:MAG: efflux RND transporter permease subunit, partial [Gemmatimonadota bacterium]